MRAFSDSKSEIITFSPGLRTGDDLAAYWLRQVTLRLRREICWCRYERGAVTDSQAAVLPPYVDKAADSLNMHRNWEEKKKFFATDATAKYLTQQLQAAPSPGVGEVNRGSFGWVVKQLQLEDAAIFVLALGLAVVFDSAVGNVISACLNDPMKTYPTLSLAQKLWDQPEKILQMADPGHPLFRSGLVQSPVQASASDSFIDWESALSVPTLVANQLLSPGSPLPAALTPVKLTKDNTHNDIFTIDLRQVTGALNSINKDRLRIVPISGKAGAAHRETVYAIAEVSGQTVVECKDLPGFHENSFYLKTLATFCWLRGFGLYLGPEAVSFLTRKGDQQGQQQGSHWYALGFIAVTIFISITERGQLKSIPGHLLLPKVRIPGFSFQERCQLWRNVLGVSAKGLEPVIAECSRRFRYEKGEIRRIAEGILKLTGPLTGKDLIDACRAHLELDLGELAQEVTPRFKEERLILPHQQHYQFQEVVTAMKSLTRVHYEWGTAEVWNESGISVLFAGPPGTGKTMAAEVLALELDLPIFRIDLSQVVNKYIGETEKNLKRLFDAADISDMILFFDEADSLFGRRTEVKDAHDRYANLEISYLLERMERFKGLAILATNRKKDLDDAFLRRLRYIIDFPFPGREERERIWRQVIPAAVDYSGVDIDFLANQFQLTGGHIRSIVFNACLQGAGLNNTTTKDTKYMRDTKKGDGKAHFKGRLKMEQVVAAVKREYDKMDRTVSLEHFGQYAGIIEKMELKNGKQ